MSLSPRHLHFLPLTLLLFLLPIVSSLLSSLLPPSSSSFFLLSPFSSSSLSSSSYLSSPFFFFNNSARCPGVVTPPELPGSGQPGSMWRSSLADGFFAGELGRSQLPAARRTLQRHEAAGFALGTAHCLSCPLESSCEFYGAPVSCPHGN